MDRGRAVVPSSSSSATPPSASSFRSEPNVRLMRLSPQQLESLRRRAAGAANVPSFLDVVRRLYPALYAKYNAELYFSNMLMNDMGLADRAYRVVVYVADILKITVTYRVRPFVSQKFQKLFDYIRYKLLVDNLRPLTYMKQEDIDEDKRIEQENNRILAEIEQQKRRQQEALPAQSDDAATSDDG